jgi:serine/threonine-protein kinase
LIEEFIDDETLDGKQRKLGVLNPHLGARVLHNLAKGVAASHRANVIHRDLKPSNVMATKGVNVNFPDFTRQFVVPKNTLLRI